MSESASGSEGPQDPIAGFLWGNVDENNKLDADYLDAVSYDELFQLMPADMIVIIYLCLSHRRNLQLLLCSPESHQEQLLFLS